MLGLSLEMPVDGVLAGPLETRLDAGVVQSQDAVWQSRPVAPHGGVGAVDGVSLDDVVGGLDPLLVGAEAAAAA